MAELTGPNLGMKHGWNLGETGWNTGLDNDLIKLDTLCQLLVKDRDLTAPPGSPTTGDRYIVGPSATGAWAGKDGQVALYINSGWAFYVPKVGWVAYVDDEHKLIVYKATGWADLTGVTDHGFLTGLADDDHTQYHNDARGDARYSQLGHDHAGVYQPLDAELTALAGLTSASDTMPYFTGPGTAAVTTLTSAGRALLADADAAAQRTTLAAAGSAVSNTFTANQVISVTDNTNAALRITQAGTGNALVVEDAANPDSTPFVITSDGVVLRGHPSSVTQNTLTSAAMQLHGSGGNTSTFTVTSWSASSLTGGQVYLGHSRSTTPGTFSILSNGDLLGQIVFLVDDGNALLPGAFIRAFVDNTPGTDDTPARLSFWTSANGTKAPVEALRVNSSQAVLCVNPTGGLGYGAGAGGAVTQITSRTTGVTLNNVSGDITLVNAAGTASWQSFTVTNSTVSATDTPIVVQKSGTDLYMIHVTNVAVGSFQVTFATTGGTTTEQPVFHFNLMRGVSA